MKNLLIALLMLGSMALVEAKMTRFLDTNSGFSYGVEVRNELDYRNYRKDISNSLKY